MSLEKRGQDNDAAKIYAAILSRYPENTRVADALLRVRTTRILAAIKLGAITPEHLKPLIALCEAGQFREAQYAFENLAKAFPEHAPLLNIGGVIHSRMRLFEKAVECFQASLSLQPDTASTYSNLGNVLLESGDVEAAEAAFEKALALAPEDVFTLSNLGRLQASHGRFEEAETNFRHCLSIAPHNIEIILNLGNLLIDLERLEDSVTMLRDALQRHSADWRVHKSLAVALVRLQQNESALAHYRTALELNPGVPEIEHMVDALSGAHRDRASANYVETLFDGFARNFDENLTGKLGYKLPEETAQVLRDLRGAGPVNNILDLGCGTGLLGRHVRDFADVLVGVDLSSKMLERAAATGHYDELIKAEAHEFLTSCKTGFDVIVALDVLIYIGEMESLLAAAAGCCTAGSHIVLSTESLDGTGFALMPSGRYSHADSYVDSCAAGHDFTIERRDRTIIRTEQGKPVSGTLHVLRRSH